MAKWTANLKATFNRAFPERQIYHRSGGTVRYISVSPWQQAMFAAGVTALAGWTVFATGSFVLGGGSGISGNPDDRELAKYERWVQELRAKDALSRSLLEERTDAFQKETVEWEERQKALEDLYKQLKGDEDLEVSSLKGDGASLLVESSIDEADARQSRDALQMTAQIDTAGMRGSVKGLKFGQERILDEAEQLATDRAERARGILALTSVGTDNIMAGAGTGGPYIPLATATAGRDAKGNKLPAEDATFYSRLAQTQARVAEMTYYEDIVSALPLGRPVGVPYRLTSNYGVRVDPFNKRPGWHNGVDLAAYHRAPIVAAGPGVVSYAGPRAGYGRLVEIDHGHGFKSRYGHLNAITVKKGDTVEVGDLVGRMGTTGRSTGDHLHFEVWFNGKPYDPIKFLKAGRHVHEE
ncbi:MAG: peptidoglycan DD-metalloendopeptidase family protein [Hyphomonas sp.]|nr:M23 family metallopeptidase [Hyphomonas sp.]MCB9960731.1 M23 family metallopeptidase [Hyphomonas sp.]MCB9971920.1 M23 family metallopeptidase [Hyphomonas sp.]